MSRKKFLVNKKQKKSSFSRNITKNKGIANVNYDVTHRINDIYDFNNESEAYGDRIRNYADLYEYYSNLQQKGLGKPYEINIKKKDRKDNKKVLLKAR